MKKAGNTNLLPINWDITPEEVALIYKYRWSIELTFKKIKQNFQLHFFYSDTASDIKTQIWCTLIAPLLLTVLKFIRNTNDIFLGDKFLN